MRQTTRIEPRGLLSGPVSQRISPHPRSAHHLFPSVAFVHYPAVNEIIRQECEKRGVLYIHYDTLPSILVAFNNYMRDVGAAETQPITRSQPSEAVLARI